MIHLLRRLIAKKCALLRRRLGLFIAALLLDAE